MFSKLGHITIAIEPHEADGHVSHQGDQGIVQLDCCFLLFKKQTNKKTQTATKNLQNPKATKKTPKKPQHDKTQPPPPLPQISILYPTHLSYFNPFFSSLVSSKEMDGKMI